jgi:hypothetical protein
MEVSNTDKVVQEFISERSREVTKMIMDQFTNLNKDATVEDKVKVIFTNIVQTYYEGYYLGQKLSKNK